MDKSLTIKGLSLPVRHYPFIFLLIIIPLILLITNGPNPWLSLIFLCLILSVLIIIARPMFLLPLIIISRSLIEGGKEANLPWMEPAPSVLGAVVILCFFTILLTNRKSIKKTGPKILASFVLFSLTGILISMDISSFKGFSRIVSWLAVFTIGAYFIKDKKYLKYPVLSFAIAGILASMFFVYSFLTGKLVMSYYHYGISGLFSFSSRNMFSVYLASIVPIIFGGRTLFANKSIQTFLSITAIWFCVAVMATHSRVGITLLFIGCFLWFLLVSKKAVVWLAGAITLIYYLAPFVVLRFQDIGFRGQAASATILERLEYWRYGIHLIQRSPFLGNGLNNPFAFHNSYIQVAVELGIIGAILFLFLLLYFIYKSYASFRNANDNQLKNFIGGCLISQIIIMVAMFTENTYSGTAVMWVFWIVAGMVGARAGFANKPALKDAEGGN